MKMTDKHRRAAFLLAQGTMNQKQIAAEIGVSRQSIVVWKTHDEFKRVIEESLDPFLDRQRTEALLLKTAYKTLDQIMSQGVNEGAKVNAAKYVVETFRKKARKSSYKTSNQDEISTILKVVEKK